MPTLKGILKYLEFSVMFHPPLKATFTILCDNFPRKISFHPQRAPGPGTFTSATANPARRAPASPDRRPLSPSWAGSLPAIIGRYFGAPHDPQNFPPGGIGAPQWIQNDPGAGVVGVVGGAG
jgi:hypothetical protein